MTTILEPTEQSRKTRREDGRFAASRNPLDLYPIVRDVAQVAAVRDDDPNKDPTTVTQAQWNSARRTLESKYGAIPQANEVCRQLADRNGVAFAWRELLALVFDSSRDIKKTHEQRLSEPDRTLTERHVVYALRRAAAELGVATLLPHEYESSRRRLLDSGQRDGRELALRRMLPTHLQLEHFCDGSWDRALEVAGLSPRPSFAPPVATGLPIVDAIVAFYCGRGFLPTPRELEDAGRAAGHSYEGRKGRTWGNLLEKARDRIAVQGLPAPPPYGTEPPAAWESLPLDLAEPPSRRVRRYSHVDVVESVRRFATTLGGASPTHGRWRSFCRGEEGIPSLNVVKEHGGLVPLMSEGSLPDWRERAEAWIDSRLPTDEEREAIEAERLSARALTPRAEEVCNVIERRGEATTRIIADELGWKPDKVRDCLRVLKKAGRIEPTQKRAQDKNQAYRITSTGDDPAGASEPL